jgi:hypothetical protein
VAHEIGSFLDPGRGRRRDHARRAADLGDAMKEWLFWILFSIALAAMLAQVTIVTSPVSVIPALAP